MKAEYDILAIGHAILDVIARADDSLIAEEAMAKSTMALIDTARAEHLYGRMEEAIETSGGSAANTAVGVASLGGRAAFLGTVADDDLGATFRRELEGAGVTSHVLTLSGNVATGRCLIFVTPDAERTMNTDLGAACLFGESMLDDALFGMAEVLYLEGYLFSSPANKAQFVRAATAARAAGRKVAISLSDTFCVNYHRAEFMNLIDNHVDILFANEAEVTALYECDFEAACRHVAEKVKIACLTRGAQGSVLLAHGERAEVPAAHVASVIDTTGAGDLYAAGFLYGFTRGLPLSECGRIAAIAAGEVIGHIGPRPEVKLETLLAA